MRLEDLVRIRDFSLAEKTRLAYLDGFETEFRRRWNRKPTGEELERALRRFPRPQPSASEPDQEQAPPRCRQSGVRRGSAGR